MVELLNGLLVSGRADDTIRLWDVDTGECEKVLEGHKRCVLSLVVLPNGLLASGSWDCTIRLWDVDTGECKEVLQGHTSS